MWRWCCNCAWCELVNERASAQWWLMLESGLGLVEAESDPPAHQGRLFARAEQEKSEKLSLSLSLSSLSLGSELITTPVNNQ